MPFLHYGADKSFEIPEDDVQVVLRMIADAIDGNYGWVGFTDTNGDTWSILISPGVLVYMTGEVTRRSPTPLRFN